MENSSENATPIFDAEKVCDLIRQEYARGRQPATLILGRRESESYRALLKHPHGESIGEHYFYGLQVVETTETTKMALVGDKGAWED